MYDVIIVGGGPAGISAALILARCLRKVLVFDTGLPRNRWAKHMNGFITRDGMNPTEFVKAAKDDLFKYDVEWRNMLVEEAECKGDYFEISIANGEKVACRKLLIATGLKDTLPEIDGVEEYYGKSVHHCPYCDGYEHRDKVLIAYGKGAEAKGLALSLKNWSKDVIFCSEGKPVSKSTIDILASNEVVIKTAKIKCLNGADGILKSLSFVDGSTILADAIFFIGEISQQSNLSKILQCTFTEKGVVKTDRFHKTNVNGLYVAGDADKDMQQVVVAAAEGTKAAISINKELQEEDREAASKIFNAQRKGVPVEKVDAKHF